MEEEAQSQKDSLPQETASDPTVAALPQTTEGKITFEVTSWIWWRQTLSISFQY